MQGFAGQGGIQRTSDRPGKRAPHTAEDTKARYQLYQETRHAQESYAEWRKRVGL